MILNNIVSSNKIRHSYTTDLVSLLSGICSVPSALNTAIHGIQLDSRKVKKGDLFIALSGSRSVSTDHIVEAVARGANAIVAEGQMFKGRVFEDGDAVELFVDNLKIKVGEIANRFFQFPSQELDVIGVTGTNGKTSVVSYIGKYLALQGTRSGFIGTLGYGLSEGEVYSTDNTTPNVVDVHRYLAELRDQNVEVVAMEVSSHGLQQGRTDQVQFKGAVFTNLTREHLDYHGTMESYADAKKLLFKCKSLKFIVVNNDDAYANTMVQGVSGLVNVIRYSITPTANTSADIAVQSYELKAGIEADVNTTIGCVQIKSQLMGRFNLSNLLAVLGLGIALGHKIEKLSYINDITPVVGRMEVVQLKNQAKVVVDYAHTPDALENALIALKPHCSGKVFLVFGCGGNRDAGKRPAMAAVGEALADYIIVTDDNPRDEMPEKIVADIIGGFKSKDRVSVIHSRADAIFKAISLAGVNDVVLIAGKGHETWQEFKGERTYFSDIHEVKNYAHKVKQRLKLSEGEQ